MKLLALFSVFIACAPPHALPPLVVFDAVRPAHAPGHHLVVVHDRLTVFSDGRATLGRRSFRLSPAVLRELRRALVRARFASLRSSYTPPGLAMYMPNYRITYGGRTVLIMPARECPARLRAAFDLLVGLDNRNRR
jgi:hypothetical protein